MKLLTPASFDVTGQTVFDGLPCFHPAGFSRISIFRDVVSSDQIVFAARALVAQSRVLAPASKRLLGVGALDAVGAVARVSSVDALLAEGLAPLSNLSLALLVVSLGEVGVLSLHRVSQARSALLVRLSCVLRLLLHELVVLVHETRLLPLEGALRLVGALFARLLALERARLLTLDGLRGAALVGNLRRLALDSLDLLG